MGTKEANNWITGTFQRSKLQTCFNVRINPSLQRQERGSIHDSGESYDINPRPSIQDPEQSQDTWYRMIIENLANTIPTFQYDLLDPEPYTHWLAHRSVCWNIIFCCCGINLVEVKYGKSKCRDSPDFVENEIMALVLPIVKAKPWWRYFRR